MNRQIASRPSFLRRPGRPKKSSRMARIENRLQTARDRKMVRLLNQAWWKEYFAARPGAAWPGAAWLGLARQGKARKGKANQK